MKIERIATVTNVQLHIDKTNPPVLHVTATGDASNNSHHSPRLARRQYIVFPEDGIQEYDFVIEVPEKGGADVMTPHKAQDKWAGFPSELKGVRIYARTNSQEKMI